MGAIFRIVFSVAALALAGFAILTLSERSRLADQAAERHALLTRDAELNRAALAPGSTLSCLDGGAGEVVENACEKLIFATPQSAASAVAYMEARLKLLADAVATHDSGAMGLLASTRRAVALDRFGVAAHVLAIRDSCTAQKCDAFALVDDPSALKSNLSAQVYDQYISRYVAEWNAAAKPAEKGPAVSALPTPAPAPVASLNGQTPTPAVKSDEHWDFPSAASIPAVSIMNAEPPVPKGTEAQAQAGQPGQAAGHSQDQAQANGKPTAKPATDARAAAAPKTPLPQAAPPATR